MVICFFDFQLNKKIKLGKNHIGVKINDFLKLCFLFIDFVKKVLVILVLTSPKYKLD